MWVVQVFKVFKQFRSLKMNLKYGNPSQQLDDEDKVDCDELNLEKSLDIQRAKHKLEQVRKNSSIIKNESFSKGIWFSFEKLGIFDSIIKTTKLEIYRYYEINSFFDIT